MATVSDRIRWVRDKRDVSRPALAKLSGVKYPTLAGIENGDQGSSTQLPAIARALNARIEYLETGRGEWDATKDATTGTGIAAQIDGIRLVQTAMARVLAGSIQAVGHSLADELRSLPAQTLGHEYVQDVLATLDAALPPQARRVPLRPAQGSTGRKHS